MEGRPPLEKDEYEIQFYERAVREMYKELDDFYLDNATESMKNMAKLVKRQLGEERKDKVAHIDKNLDSVCKEMAERTKRKLGNLQDMMENKIFQIPDDVVLPEDKCQVLYADMTINKVDQEFDQLLARYETVRFLTEAANDEIQCHQNMFPATKEIVDDLEKRAERIEGLRVKPETVAQLGKIEELLRK
ncbi:uncharacterized protein LOC132192478 [Neocloeon triangulifer]|uniref:uncharacterized protein LOC132192478 n=1 Tax=Neocloeon triangulifer TaxID=2078957 RepID=UPI00286F238F|nr:uncharacterized protein LOC132192478 [Neocloeon triangulifer]